MARTRPRSTEVVPLRRFATVGLVALVLLAPFGSGARPPLADAPVIWFADDDRPVPVPQYEESKLVPYAMEAFLGRPFSRFWNPARAIRHIGGDGPVGPALDINSLDEVVDSAWFNNRIGMRPLDAAELAEGPAFGLDLAAGPDMDGGLVIIGAKSAGVTPGFTVRDGRGDTWLLKFDPPNHPGMTIRAGVVSNLIFHAIGFNTPVDRIVVFDRDDLVIEGEVSIKLQRGQSIGMTPANLDSILQATGSVFGGRYHALGSRYLDGRLLGSFDDQGRRQDDPNDLIPHQDRRELRALKVFCAWINHFDMKRQNTLDVYTGTPGQGHVQHFLIDFASTLGAFGDRFVPRFGFEFGIDVFPILGRTLTLGLVEDAWADLAPPPGLPEIGLFEATVFDPGGWKPDLPHSGMANLTLRDGYWAAKVISAFTEEDLRVIVAQAQYQDPRAERYLLDVLLARQAEIVNWWFDQVPPLDFFRPTANGIGFDDLAVARGFAASGETTYRYRLARFDSSRKVLSRSDWIETTTTDIPLGGPRERRLEAMQDNSSAFLGLEVQVNRGRDWSRSTTAYLALASNRVVAVDR